MRGTYLFDVIGLYKMRFEGASFPKIAKALNPQKVNTSSDDTYQRLGKPNPYISNHLRNAAMERVLRFRLRQTWTATKSEQKAFDERLVRKLLEKETVFNDYPKFRFSPM